MAALLLQLICDSGRSLIWLWKLDLISRSSPSLLHRTYHLNKDKP